MSQPDTLIMSVMEYKDTHIAELTCDKGTMRMILDGALKDANLWTRAVGASTETKNHWSRRAKIIKGLLDQLPEPVNPRDPFEDLPDEPMPDEAKAIWKERAAAEDARAAAKFAAQEKRPSPDDDIHMIDGYGPMTTAQVEELQDSFATPVDDMDDLLA